ARQYGGPGHYLSPPHPPAARISRPVIASNTVAPLLPSHRDPEPLLRRDQVVEILGSLVEVDLHPRPGAAEEALLPLVVVRHGRGRVASDVRGLVSREDHRLGA